MNKFYLNLRIQMRSKKVKHSLPADFPFPPLFIFIATEKQVLSNISVALCKETCQLKIKTHFQNHGESGQPKKLDHSERRPRNIYNAILRNRAIKKAE